MSSDIRDENPHDPVSNDEGMTGNNGLNGFTHAQTPFDQAENSHPSPYHSNPTGEGMNMPSSAEEPIPRRTRTKGPSIFDLRRQAAGRPEGVITSDSGKYATSPPFEEAGPTSSVWNAYLDERYHHDSDIFGSQRGTLNIILVFAGLFSAVVTSFISQSSANLQPDYQQISALLLFDQINIQRALANGTSLDHITTSGADPTAPFTPKHRDAVINGLWFTSLTISLAISIFAIIADQWYASYLSPIAGNAQARARIRHLRYKALIDSYGHTLICQLPWILYLSLYLFLIGLVLYVIPLQRSVAIMIGIISLLPIIANYMICHFPGIYQRSLQKQLSLWISCNPLSQWMLRRLNQTFIFYLLSISTISLASSMDLEDLERSAVERSRIENEVDALLWLYESSSTSAARRLVIQALSGLPPDYIEHAKEAFSLRWDEIRDEKEGMLMDCMELSRDGHTRWIPKDILNIDRRIEPLLRLEILFPALSRKYPYRHFGDYDLEFSTSDISNTLSITLFSIDDEHIRNPREQKEVVINALADNSVHYPLVWKKLLDCDTAETGLFDNYPGNVLTVDMCRQLFANIYSPSKTPSVLYTCTLAQASAIYFKPHILQNLLSWFKETSLDRDVDDLEEKCFLDIKEYLQGEAAQLVPMNGLVKSMNRSMNWLRSLIEEPFYGVVDTSSRPTEGFLAILSYIRSDLFTDSSSRSGEYPEFERHFWACRAHALVFMASLLHGTPETCIVEPPLEWATKPFCSNILRDIRGELPSGAFDYKVCSNMHLHFYSVKGAACFLLGDAFSRRIIDAYEAFRENNGFGGIAMGNNLDPDLIEILRGYITGLSEAKAGVLADTQSGEFLDWHIQYLHQVHIIGFICASITYSDTPRRRILSSLVSIDPSHSEWDGMLKTFAEKNGEYLYQKYILDKGAHPEAQERLKESMKATVRVLDKCLEAERDRRNGINWLSKRLNYHTSSAETRREARLRKGKERVQDPEGGH